MAIKDQLGDRIKSKFEDVFRISIPQRTYGIIRIDGKSFHTFTRGLERPYCKELSFAMDTAAAALAKQMMGCKLAYGQSDEYSFLFTDLEKDESEMWFAGNIQKIASVSASIFTAVFNYQWSHIAPCRPINLAMFDARVFVISNPKDVESYFLWRQLDATRNSLNMLASCYFSHKELMGKDSAAKHEMLYTKDVNWNNQSIPFKRGRVVCRQPNHRTVSYTHKKTKQEIVQEVDEMLWVVDEKIPVFSRDKEYLERLIL